MPADLSLPETAKALSAPVTKLIEVCAAGCGKLYEPTGIRRRARAEGDALVIMEEAKGRASDVTLRAAQRLLDVEERRQENIDSIVAQAKDLLPEEVSEAPVDPDWAARFFADCEDIGNEQMQTVWARLLAGEVATPGSFSMRTLWVLKNLAPREAQSFNVLCKSTFRSGPKEFFPFVGIGPRDYFDKLGLGYLALQRLVESGLIIHSPGLRRAGTIQFVLRAPHVSLLVQSDEPSEVPLGNVLFTVAGAELASICEWEIPEERVAQIEGAMKRPLRVTRGQVPKFTDETYEWVPL